METREWRTMDKSGWGSGPWQDEPDKKQWRDEATGLPCLIVRNGMGALCGYVGMPAVPLGFDTEELEVHGGITFGPTSCQEGPEADTIGHVDDDGQPVLWAGFDCAHCDDFLPGTAALLGNNYGLRAHQVYRNLAYVEGQCRELAKQVSDRIGECRFASCNKCRTGEPCR